MMNRTLLKASRRCQETIRLLPGVSNTAFRRQTFLTYGRVRTLTSTSYRLTDDSLSSQSGQNTSSAEEKGTAVPRHGSEPSQHIPWYLQEESPVPAATETVLSGQIPELPENPPVILPVLLEYVFKDLGLDNLKLIDLRGLETPPALGANVIMIIGTARSVKHLNVSADRLCRWLRSNWKLSPYADGLLGRNELKIKLRRKARRARLASQTGAMVDEKDDGITTGWICVNAGVVEKGPAQEQPDDGFEGFGQLDIGTRIVVQLFTEEKRAELDLEGFWEQNLARAEREKQKYSQVSSDAPEKVRSPNSVNLSLSPSPSPSDYEFGNVPRSSVSLPLEQRRQFHSKRQYQHSRPTSYYDIQPTSLFKDPDSPYTTISPVSDALGSLWSLPREEIIAHLGAGLHDTSSTKFLRRFYGLLSKLPVDQVSLCLARLMCLGILRRHPGYTKDILYRHFKGCFVSAAIIPETLGSGVVAALLTPRPGTDQSPRGWLPDSDKDMALDILDQLILRGIDVMKLDLFTKVYVAACLPSRPEGDDTSLAERGAHVVRMIDVLDVPFHAVHARRLMRMLFVYGDYDAFWKWWRKLPLKKHQRTAEDYSLLFGLHAELGDEHRVRECLSTWAPMLGREDPPITPEGELLRHLRECLFLVDPEVAKSARKGSQTYFARLWRHIHSKSWERL